MYSNPLIRIYIFPSTQGTVAATALSGFRFLSVFLGGGGDKIKKIIFVGGSKSTAKIRDLGERRGSGFCLFSLPTQLVAAELVL